MTEPRRLERWCMLTLQFLAASFAVVGLLFFSFPDGTIWAMNVAGSILGNFPSAPSSELRFWNALAAGYMAMVTALAYLAQRDLRANRMLLLILALGKATSSLSWLVYYQYSGGAFAYIASGVIDGVITIVTLAIWAVIPYLKPPLPRPAPISEPLPAAAALATPVPARVESS